MGAAVEQLVTFAEVLEAVDKLSDDEQAALVEIVRRSAAELGRKRIAAEAAEAQHEFAEGRCSPATPRELMDEIVL